MKLKALNVRVGTQALKCKISSICMTMKTRNNDLDTRFAKKVQGNSEMTHCNFRSILMARINVSRKNASKEVSPVHCTSNKNVRVQRVFTAGDAFTENKNNLYCKLLGDPVSHVN